MDSYCLDANFFVEAWNKYYSPDFCNDYWNVVEDLGNDGIIFIPIMVKNEIDKIDDSLKEWFKGKDSFVKEINKKVQDCIKEIYAKDPKHMRLVDSTKGRSIADPWVIAHAMAEDAIVVTKEYKEANPNTKRIKIPNVCDNMGIKWIDDFDFIRELKISFECKR